MNLHLNQFYTKEKTMVEKKEFVVKDDPAFRVQQTLAHLIVLSLCKSV